MDGLGTNKLWMRYAHALGSHPLPETKGSPIIAAGHDHNLIRINQLKLTAAG
jgi:hypothetical protein